MSEESVQANDPCRHSCQNFPGFFRCSCKDGYQLRNNKCQGTKKDKCSLYKLKGKKTSIIWKGVFSFRCWWVCHWGLRSRLWKYQRKLSLLLLSRISIGIKRSMCRWVELLTFLWHCSGKTGARMWLRQVERHDLLSQKDNAMTEQALEVPTFQSGVILVYIYSDLVLVKR